MTRNEVDVLRLNIVHHLQTACDRIIVLDNGSTDKSKTVLKRLAAKLPVEWTSDASELDQGEVVSGLIQEARAKGADWVIPLDTDEFWHSGRRVHEILADDDGSGALEVSRIEFIQARDQLRASARSVLRATLRVAEPTRGTAAIDEYLAGERSMFETEPQPKVLVRATPDVAVKVGCHTATGLEGPVTVTQELAIFHVPLRSKLRVIERAASGRRLTKLDPDPHFASQAHYWDRMSAKGMIDEAWRAHSYKDGALDVAGRRVELIEDLRLVELLEPWVRSAKDQVIARYTGRSW